MTLTAPPSTSSLRSDRRRPVAPADQATTRRTVPRRVDGPGRSSGGVDPQVWALHVRYQRTGDPADLTVLVEEYRPYAASLARKLYREGVPLEDLCQVAMEALVTALQRFDCERRIPFCGFASPSILGALKRYYRDHGWAIRIPRSLQDLAVPVRDATERLAADLGRAPSPREVADEVGVDVEEVRRLDTATHARRTSSLDAPREDGAGPREVAATDRDLDLAVDLVAASEAVEMLDARSREVLVLSFFDELTQTEIGERYGVSQMQVSRWIRSALDRLRSHLVAG